MDERRDRHYEEGASPVDVALCIAPHLRDFLVVDQRHALPGRPRVQLVSADNVYDEQFYHEIEEQFSDMLRQREQPFLTLLSLPQATESVVRQESLAAILRAITEDGQPNVETARISVLFVGQEMLSSSEAALEQAVRDVLGSEADSDTIGEAFEQLKALVDRERRATERTREDWLREAITGDSEDFLTIWQQSYNP